METDGAPRFEHNYATFVVLRPQLALGLVEYDFSDDSSFLIDGVSYTPVESRGWGVFYDWLRNNDGTLIGFRGEMPSSVDPDLYERLYVLFGYLDYAKLDEKGWWFEIYFGDGSTLDAERSISQNFGWHRLLSAADGTYAVTFQTDWLTLEDFAALRQAPVSWVEVTASCARTS